MRRKDREVKDINRILKIIDKAKILHFGMFTDEYPYIVPLHYGYEYEDGCFIFYMHSAKEGYKLDLIRNNPKVCIELGYGVEVISGDQIQCKYGAAYSSVIGRGKAEIIDNEQEKIKGLKLLMLNQTHKEFNINEKMAASVIVLKVTIEDFTAKERSAPSDK